MIISHRSLLLNVRAISHMAAAKSRTVVRWTTKLDVLLGATTYREQITTAADVQTSVIWVPQFHDMGYAIAYSYIALVIHTVVVAACVLVVLGRSH